MSRICGPLAMNARERTAEEREAEELPPSIVPRAGALRERDVGEEEGLWCNGRIAVRELELHNRGH